jgi:parvulin-like peptidyl-prolyl isomerase
MSATDAASTSSGPSSHAGDVPNSAGTVVEVGGAPITKSAIEHWMMIAVGSSASGSGKTTKAVLPEPLDYTACIAHMQAGAAKSSKAQNAPTTVQEKTRCEQQYDALQKQALGYLISTRWLEGEASEQGIKVSDGEVQRQFQQIKSQQFHSEADFQKFLATSGEGISDLLLRVKTNLLSSKVQQKITEAVNNKSKQAEITSYYNENKSRYSQPQKRNILVVLTATQAQAEAAKTEISSGKSFASVAKSKSIDASSKVNGGSHIEVTEAQEPKALGQAVFAAKTGVLGGPVKTPAGYYIYEVKKMIPSEHQSLSQARPSITQQLRTQRQQKALGEFVKNYRARWTARTRCRQATWSKTANSTKHPVLRRVHPLPTR